MKLINQNQPPSLLNWVDRYTENLQIGIFPSLFSIFHLVRSKASCMLKISFLGDMKVVKVFGDRPTNHKTDQPTDKATYRSSQWAYKWYGGDWSADSCEKHSIIRRNIVVWNLTNLTWYIDVNMPGIFSTPKKLIINFFF